MWTPIELLNLAWTQLWQVTLVSVLVGLVSYLLRVRQWHPSIANSLWLLVLAKALTPPLWSSSWSVFSWTDVRVVKSYSNEALPGTFFASQWASTILVMVLVVWAAGFLGLLVHHLFQWRRLQELIESTRLPVDQGLNQRVNELAQRLSIRNCPPVVVTRAELGPALAGIWRPKILLPDSLVLDSKWSDIEPIVAHELLHLRRRDTLISAIQLVANAVWWFHPLIRWAGKQVEEASERCVDLAVLHVAGCNPATYCRSLLRVLQSREESQHCLLMAAPAVRGVSVTCQRIHILANVPQKPKTWQRLVSLTGVLLLGAVFLPGKPLDLLTKKQCSSTVVEQADGNPCIVSLDRKSER